MKEKLDWAPRNWGRNAFLVASECFRGGLFWALRKNRHDVRIVNPVLSEALGGKVARSDIADHLNTILFFASDPTNRLMVELGTRGGESTRALLAAAEATHSLLLSVDIDDCSKIRVPFDNRWNFVQASDVEFGTDGFVEWCKAHEKEPVIDVLFIDTSHEYAHTCQELAIWSLYLADDGVVILHDTNMGNGVYAKMNGSLGAGWDNQRGVIRAVEEFLGTRYDETVYFCDLAKEFAVMHFPWSNGLTVLKKRGTKG